MNITESSGNVFEDLGFDKEEAANLLIRTELIVQIRDYFKKHKLKQKMAAEILGVKQPDISAIMKLRIEKFTIDRLVNFLARLNHKIEVSSKPGRRVFKIIDSGKQATHA